MDNNSFSQFQASIQARLIGGAKLARANERQRRESFRGSGGMLPRTILKFRTFEICFISINPQNVVKFLVINCTLCDKVIKQFISIIAEF